ncbi:hypothetical protein BJX62DRAFT_206377 [Aspergillus germanicus]
MAHQRRQRRCRFWSVLHARGMGEKQDLRDLGNCMIVQVAGMWISGLGWHGLVLSFASKELQIKTSGL